MKPFHMPLNTKCRGPVISPLFSLLSRYKGRNTNGMLKNHTVAERS